MKKGNNAKKQKNLTKMESKKTPTEQLLEEVVVVEAVVVEAVVEAVVVEAVKSRKSGVTAKTLGALKEMIERVKESKLLNAEEFMALEESVKKLRKAWINKNM